MARIARWVKTHDSGATTITLVPIANLIILIGFTKIVWFLHTILGICHPGYSSSGLGKRLINAGTIGAKGKAVGFGFATVPPVIGTFIDV